MKAAEKTALRALFGRRSPAEIKALAALIRATDDRALRAALAPPRVRPKVSSSLTKDVAEALKPLMAPAAEKADLLIEHMARHHRVEIAYAPRGLADAVRRLRKRFTDRQIRAGAKHLAAELARRHGGRDAIV
ncbi:MAG: hypothetical protein AB7P07_03770 [Hyphomonadaceae bacterium]